MPTIRTIVLPHDFSEYANSAMDIALELSRALAAELHLLHVLQPPAYTYGSEIYAGGPLYGVSEDHLAILRESELRLSAIADEVSTSGLAIHSSVVEGSRIAESIDQEAARLVADLIIMGTHGRTGLAHLLLGSVAEETLRYAPCPVLTVPRHKRVHVESPHSVASKTPVPGAL